jgi:hypothetical protein
MAIIKAARLRQFAWFVGLWAASVAAVGTLALVLRLWLK